MNLRALNILPLISIIIPLYNTEKFILDCISSIESQAVDFSLIEVLVVDDCSTDSSIKILRKLKNKNLKILSNVNKLGYDGSINKGINFALKKKLLLIIY